ncbi:unnamed protein product [Phytomonas sp. EM1]|nr:unnamed protein product [Phytomonas sp. EM1]|eukprot:CCW60903.1 unnamed protein product [Phytomonas sp. isolate EM1]
MTPMSENRVIAPSKNPEESLSEKDTRLRTIMAEYNFDVSSLPSLEVLREERVRLIEEIRHHKDEQDSLSLDIEGLEGAAELYNTAARVQRLENFVAEGSVYVEKVLPGEIERFLEDDRRRSDEEVAAYAQELDSRRERILQKASAAKERTTKLANRQASKHVDPELDDGIENTIAHVDGNVGQIELLSDKVKKFRTLKSKLLAELAREKKDSAGMEKNLNIQIKNAELSNARDARLSKELNASNASLTANVQLLMNQLNVEHYGIDNVPTNAQLEEGYRNRMLMLEATPVNARESVPEPELPVYESLNNGDGVESGPRSRGSQPLPTPLRRMESQGSRRSGPMQQVPRMPSERVNPTPKEMRNGSRHGSMSLPRISEKPVESVHSHSNTEENVPKAGVVY